MKKPQEDQKATALWKMKAAKEAGEELLPPHETRLALWEEHLQDPSGALDKALKCVWKIGIGGLGPSTLEKVLSPMAAVGFLRSGKSRFGPYLDPMDSVCLRTASMEWNVPGKYGPHGELFFFLIQGGTGDCAEQ